jgi:hypothetical protein
VSRPSPYPLPEGEGTLKRDFIARGAVEETGRVKRIIPILAVLAAIALLVAGIVLGKGDISLVRQKAAKVCLECIGIG